MLECQRNSYHWFIEKGMCHNFDETICAAETGHVDHNYLSAEYYCWYERVTVIAEI